MRPVTIVIADDHSIIRDGLKNLFHLEPTFKVVGDAGDADETLFVTRTKNPDILLLDINMPGASGIEILSEIKKQSPMTKVIVLTIHDEGHYLRKALEMGADGYVLKDSDFFTLKLAINNVMNGEKFIDKKMISFMNQEKEHTEILTKREKEILILVSKGLMNKDIAARLNISEKTIKNHMSNLFRKIDVADRTQAALYAIKNNYVQL